MGAPLVDRLKTKILRTRPLCQYINVKTVLCELCRLLAVVHLAGSRSLGLAMITLLGIRQQQLLTLLLENKEGLTVEDLSKGLGITDNAVRQHLTALERDGIVVKGETQSTGDPRDKFSGLTAA